ncbi:MAG: NADP-dependent oxidoreductase [Hyphomicrobiaceae bacterium]
MVPASYRRIVLVHRPKAEPAEADFRLEEASTPIPGPDQILVRVVYLSLDPYMRGRMRDEPSYAPPIEMGEVMPGGTVGEVVISNNPKFKVGDIVEDRLGWQEYGIGGGPTTRRIDPTVAPISTANGVLGMPGMTAYCGLFQIGRPKVGETIVISAASGAVGQTVGQLARLAGCRVVGIAGNSTKCAYVCEELGFDACIDYNNIDNLDAALKRECPDGIDVYFDNVGGPISDAVTLQLNTWARVVVCGAISQYNAAEQEMGPRLPAFFVGRRVTMRGFIVSDFAAHFEPARRIMGKLVQQGRIKYREHIVDGLENAPRAFMGLFQGDNFGKLQIQVAPESASA